MVSTGLVSPGRSSQYVDPRLDAPIRIAKNILPLRKNPNADITVRYRCNSVVECPVNLAYVWSLSFGLDKKTKQFSRCVNRVFRYLPHVAVYVSACFPLLDHWISIIWCCRISYLLTMGKAFQNNVWPLRYAGDYRHLHRVSASRRKTFLVIVYLV